MLKMHICVILIILIKLCNFILTHLFFLFIVSCYSLTYLFIEIIENSKKETSSINSISLSYFIFWYGLINSVFIFLLHPYMC